jgi:hypothetical protein
MRFIWLFLAVFIVVAALGGSTRLSDNPNARIGLYFLGAAAGLLFLALFLGSG